jgi:hypothetical protein
MKGIAHFAVGVSVASCFPVAVQAGADGNPLYFILGGVFGLLPDTFDFKFVRYFFRHDIRVTPDPLNNDPEIIAHGVAEAMEKANETGEPVRIKLDTIQLSSDTWQEYRVTLDVKSRCVRVEYGPVIDTGGEVLSCGEGENYSVPVLCRIKIDYLATVTVGAFDGPVIEMCPLEDMGVVPAFIPWHRKWSHSVIAALLFGSMCSTIWGLLAGLTAALAYGFHVLLDQFGFMGSCLWFPFGKRRSPGFGLTRSGSAFANTMVVWVSCLLVFWNLYRTSDMQFLDLNPFKLVFWGVILPLLALRLAKRHLCT